MNTCRRVPDNSDINDALLQTFNRGNITLKLYCVCTESRRNFRNLSVSRSYESGGKYTTYSQKTPKIQFILSQLNAGHALNVTVKWVASLIRIRAFPGSHFGLVIGHAKVH
jgi:hypothetical protein